MQAYSLKQWPQLRHEARPIVAGVVGGGVSTLLLHPLDMLKTRQAVFGGSLRKTLISSFKNVASETALSGLYRGVGANILVSATSWGAYFFA